jgi:serine/threonine protein kinase
MEFVGGETLENLIKRSGRLEVKLTLEIASQVAAWLAAVHKQNLVHRDIKPTNIMVSLKGERSVTAKMELPVSVAETSPRSMIRPNGRNCCRRWPMDRRPPGGI